MPARGQRRDPKPSECPLEVAAIINACLRHNAQERPTAAEVVAMLEAAPAKAPLEKFYVSAGTHPELVDPVMQVLESVVEA